MAIIKFPPGGVRAARGLFNLSGPFDLKCSRPGSRFVQILILLFLNTEIMPQFPLRCGTVAMTVNGFNKMHATVADA